MGDGIRVGISGWRYKPWRGRFYPEGLIQRKELAFASRTVTSIEINGSYYALQSPERYAAWSDEVPEDFIFSVKAPRFITHIKRLQDIDRPLANFFASGVLQLRHKLGPVLWQFPSNFKLDPERFENFFKQLPHNSEEAVQLARHCDRELQKPGYPDSGKNRQLRHAVEIRHPDGLDEDFIALLRRYKVALVIADTAGKWPYQEDITADFVYLRLHGEKELYKSGYSDDALERWTRRIQAWSDGREPADARLVSAKHADKRRSRDVYCYFDNDVKVCAPFDARQLLRKLKLTDSLPLTPGAAPDKDNAFKAAARRPGFSRRRFIRQEQPARHGRMRHGRGST